MAGKADGWESRYIRGSIKLLRKAKLEFIYQGIQLGYLL